MPFQLLVPVEIGLKEFTGFFVFIGLITVAVVAIWYSIGSQKKKLKSQAVREWRDVADAQDKRIELLEHGLSECKKEHERCERKVNGITAFNLRLQAREESYWRNINELQHRLGIPITNFEVMADATKDPDFG